MRSNAMDVQTDGTLRVQGAAEIGEEVFIGDLPVSSTLDSLLNAVASMQQTILLLQEQIDILNNGE